MKFTNDAFIKWLTTDREVEGFPLCDFERIQYEVRPADVLLIEGRSRVSDVIKAITQSAWSHSAIYIGRLHDISNRESRRILKHYYTGPQEQQLIVEGLMGEGMIVNPLSVYQQDHIRICRPKGLSPQDTQKVLDYAINRLGDDYDVRQIFDLLRFFLPWGILPRKWRSSLFSVKPGISTRTVCSSILAEAFSSVDFPILPLVKKTTNHNGIELIQRNPRLFTPRDFDYSPYFDIIKYPFIELSEHAPYRHLPWKREGQEKKVDLDGKIEFSKEDNSKAKPSPSNGGYLHRS